ncbi:MAG: type II toxin-antitoxin system RelE/ParE family toxin [Planctomycetota bacterium]
MYRVELTRAAERQLRKLPALARERIETAIEQLINDPRPRGCVAFKGLKNGYRIRVGDYRVIYQVNDGELLVVVVRVGGRRDVYRG